MLIRVGFSADPDDAFMFWALAAGKIDTGSRRYEHELADIETLNRRALKGELEVTAVSLHAYAHLADNEFNRVGFADPTGQSIALLETLSAK